MKFKNIIKKKKKKEKKLIVGNKQVETVCRNVERAYTRYVFRRDYHNIVYGLNG